MAENAPLALLPIHPRRSGPLPDSSPTLSGRMFIMSEKNVNVDSVLYLIFNGAGCKE